MQSNLLSPLGRRLAAAAARPNRQWRNLVENFPVWPEYPEFKDRILLDDYEYGETQGHPTLINEIVSQERERGVALTGRNILVTNGGFDALSLLARHLTSRGITTVICVAPVLDSIKRLFNASGLETYLIEWDEIVDIDFVKLGKRSVVYLNTPHNPTGRCLSEDLWSDLQARRSSRGASIIFDLVYGDFIHSTGVVRSPLSSLKNWDDCYAINSMSKNFGAPGLRIGWIVADQKEIGLLTGRFEFERVSVSARAQRRAARLLQHGATSLVERVHRGRDLVCTWASNLELAHEVPSGGTQLWLSLGSVDAEAFADRMMEDHAIILATGANYEPVLRNHLRLPFGCDPSILSLSLSDLAHCVRNWRTHPSAAASQDDGQ
ncbi:beta-methylarginine biosynthesis bifunctional aminotransferase [Bradyrhizobium sp. ARR65]|uniref:beta-methylarginine biosynthesis bifunctional aminotransferase n=1 Tax=Bradyrhizobium sp. ARR65 TaxID=1040989 RepID=UPI000465BCAA|nr:beta-methylarginine biosynthesis bifunctional aminotransferase [Bradyrhizobium sp. ARR65]